MNEGTIDKYYIDNNLYGYRLIYFVLFTIKGHDKNIIKNQF